MRRATFLLTALALAVAVGITGLAVAGDDHKHDHAMKKGEEITVTGTLVGTKCYGMNNDNIANKHMTPKGEMPGCATACANMGIPAGVLKDGKKGGDLYILITPSTAIADHMGATVKATGMETFDHAIIPSKIMVKTKDGKWEEVKIATMM